MLSVFAVVYIFVFKGRSSSVQRKTTSQCLIDDLSCFGLGKTIGDMREAAKDEDSLWSSRQEQVVRAFQHGWLGYSNYAFGFDEYYPMEMRGENFVEGGIGFTIVDSMDTMVLMGLTDEYNRSREWVLRNLTFDKDENLNLFETTIRVFGGLLSSHFLTGSNDTELLSKAIELGERLALGFDTISGIPVPTISIGTGKPTYESISSTAEVATLQLENKYLSYLTGNPKFWGLSQRVIDIIDRQPKLDGLAPIYIK